MKYYLLSCTLCLICNLSLGQLKITAGTQWVNSGAAVIILNDMDFVNDGTMIMGNSLMRCTGNTNTAIGGNSISSFHELELAKTGSNKVILSNNINVSNRVIFTSGLLDLNQHDLTLADIAYLDNESEVSRITGLNGGEVIITLLLNAPAGSNPGNLGAVITSVSNLGSVIIRRGHKNQSGAGMTGSIQRYFDISPANNAALDATFRYYYFDAEMNGQLENSLKMFRSTDAGASWTNQNYNNRNAIENYVEKTGINSFSRWTLSSHGVALPVTGLEFNARRISNSIVQLTWKTNQEFNNRGFHIQRKKESDANYTITEFVNSMAPGGNSSMPLSYSKADTNNFKGISYYRLKQEDIDGNFTYSVIRLVAGSGEKTVSLNVWPIPSSGDVNVLYQGIEKDILQVFDMSGRLIQQFPVLNNTQHKISRLETGSYVIRLAVQHNLAQKIIIQ